MTIIRPVLLTLLVMAAVPRIAMANDKYSGSPAARAEFEKGKIAGQSEDWKTALAHYKKAIQLDPNFADAYEEYWSARAMGDWTRYQSESEAEREKSEKQGKRHADNEIKEYQDLVRRHPDMPIYRWLIAQQYVETDPKLQEKYCTEAVELDPAFGPGYDCVASVASLRGDTNAEARALRKEIELNPEKTDLLLRLQRDVRSDRPRFEEITREIVSKLPATDSAAEALNTYAETLPEAEQIPRLEEIVANYPPSKFPHAAWAADELFGLYDRTDPGKAPDFARKMLSEMPADKEWKSKAAYEDGMAAAEAKIAAGDGNGAMALLKDTKVPELIEEARLQLLKAKAQDLAGNTSSAYDDLLKVFAERPVHEVQPVLYQYGKKLGKSENAIDEEVWNARSASAKPATPFSLESFIDKKKVSLDDYKGKIVLLDFWYPNCGPCMESMPYLQALWTKYKDSGLVFLGVNAIEGQADFVMSLVKSSKWGMIPLRGTEKWCSDVYKVHSFPATFLIGGDGRVYFRPHVYDSRQYEIAAMQIEALLAAARADKKPLSLKTPAASSSPQNPASDSSQKAAEPDLTKPSGCVAALEKYTRELSKQYHEAMQSDDDYKRLVESKVSVRAAEYAKSFSVDKVDGPELMQLAQLYARAGQWDNVQVTIRKRLERKNLTTRQRADILSEAAIMLLNNSSTGASEQPAKTLVEEFVGELDYLGEEALSQQLETCGRLVVVYAQDGDARVKTCAQRYIDSYPKLSQTDREKASFTLYFVYKSLADYYTSLGEYTRAADTMRQGVSAFSANPQSKEQKSLITISEFDLGRYAQVGKKAQPINAKYWINGAPPKGELSLEGKVTVLEFTATWCVECRGTYPAMLTLQKKYKDAGVDVVFVTRLWGRMTDSLPAEQEYQKDMDYFVGKLHLPFKIAVAFLPPEKASDPRVHDSNSANYFEQGIPQFVVVDRHGTIRDIAIGWDQGQAEKLARYVEKSLREDD